MRMVRLPDGTEVASLGQGTWHMGVGHRSPAAEADALKLGLDLGLTLIDTAEMYADGGAERVLGSALKGFGASRREALCIVSKVLPSNASRRGTIRACEASLQRLGCQYLDLYLLHWRGSYPFSETLAGFEELLQRGLIRYFGVSNLDLGELALWLDAERELTASATLQCNQLYYCCAARAIEFALLPWQRARGIRTMAYSPLGQGTLTHDPVLQRIGQERGVTAAQIALAWSVREADVVAIPKSVDPQRLEENLRAADLQLSAAELARIDQAFAPPRSKQPLETT
jgi:diketogulonate reductase-like aldo/keto reductase